MTRRAIMQNELEFEPAGADLELPDNAAIEETKPFDCATFLAWDMLRAALGKRKRPCPAGLYIIHAPSDEWGIVLRQVVGDLHFGVPRRPLRPRIANFGRQELGIFELPSTIEPRTASQITANVQDELVLGKTVYLIASNLSMVPTELQRTRDRIFDVGPPGRKWLTSLIREVVPNANRLSFSGLICEELTPAHLRLSYRKGMSAGAFLRRLKAVTKHNPEVKPTLSVTFDQLHGVDEAKYWANELKADLARYQQGHLAWHELSRGLLLSGAPGTAKTTLAGAIAEFCGMRFVPTSYAAWQRTGTGHLGDVLKAMAADFTEARTHAPALLFIDELDSLGSRERRGPHHDWWRAIINALLEQMAGTVKNSGLVIVAATNYPELVDAAILRSGRLEDKITLHPPNVEALGKIYADQLTGKLNKDVNVDVQQLGRMSAGLTGADVVKVCGTARRRARNAGRLVEQEDLLIALAGDEPSTDKARLFRIAIHEAGHAITALTFPELTLKHVTVIPRDHKGGGTWMTSQTENFLTPTGLDAYLTALLGGRAAEEILLGEFSSGAGGGEESDLGLATQLAAMAELSLGMCAQGLIWYEPPSAQKMGELFAQRPDLEQAVRERLDRAYARALVLIEAKALSVRKLAEQLLVRKVMTGEEIVALVLDVPTISSTLPLG